MIKKLLKSRFIKNTGWLLAFQIVQLFISLIVGVVSARYLGPSNYGLLTYTASFVTFFTSIVTLGMESITIKKMIKSPEDEGKYLGGGMLFRFISSIVSSIAISILVAVLDGGDRLKIILASLQSLQLIFMSFHLLDVWFQKNLNAKYISIAKMIACVVVAVFRITLLATGRSVIWFALTNVLSHAIISGLLFVFYKKNGGQKLEADKQKGLEILSESYHFIISGLAVALYGQMDRIMIGQMLSSAEVGLYSTAVQICSMWIFVPQAIISSARPLIMGLKNEGDERGYILRIQQLNSSIIWLCICCSLFISLFAKWIVFILYGNEFIQAANVLRIYIWSEVFSMVGEARGIWVVSENKNKYVKYYLIIGAGINTVLNMLLIPVVGMEGAAIATVITQFVVSTISPAFFRETREYTKIVFRSIFLKWFFEKKAEERQGI